MEVAAQNDQGAGPTSEPVPVRTLEDGTYVVNDGIYGVEKFQIYS